MKKPKRCLDARRMIDAMRSRAFVEGWCAAVDEALKKQTPLLEREWSGGQALDVLRRMRGEKR